MKRWHKILIVAIATIAVLALLAFTLWIISVIYFFGTGMCSAPDCGPEARQLAIELDLFWRWAAFLVLTLHFFLCLVWIFGRGAKTRNASRN
ncbi:MAG TPA: hypothetical protein VFO00_04115 [Vitreimonas sp.]|nr:hypothetical protein [Vitreimonas sp.]